MAQASLDIPRDPKDIAKLTERDADYIASKPVWGEFPSDPDLEQIVAMRKVNLPITSDSAVRQAEIMIPARDGHENRALVFRPANVGDDVKLPVLVIYHGGGFTMGKPEHAIDPIRSLVKQLSVVVIAPAYRLAPEHPFPQGVDDSWDSLQWIAKNASHPSVGGSLEKGFIIGGISAGANFASVLMHLARDEQLEPALTGVWLACGSCCPPSHVPERFKPRYFSRTDPECRDPPLTEAMHKVFMNAVKGPMDDPKFMSYLWPTGHANLPPVYFQICGRDYSRDEALIYADTLHEVGVKVSVDVYKGLPHVFWGAFPQLEATKKWRADTLSKFRWMLESK